MPGRVDAQPHRQPDPQPHCAAITVSQPDRQCDADRISESDGWSGGTSIEAEAGDVVAPMRVLTDSAAQGGKYVVQTASSGRGGVTFQFSIPSNGKYVLQARVIAPDGGSNSVYRSVDGSSPTSWALPEPLTTWTWAAGPTVTLTAGHHVLVLSRRESGTRLDTVRFERLAG